MGLEISKFSPGTVQEFPLRGTAAILQRLRDNNSPEKTCKPTPSTPVSPLSTFSSIPFDVMQIIGGYASEAHFRNYDSETIADPNLHQVFEPTALVPGGKTIGLIDKNILCLRADDAVKDALYSVQGDIDKLDVQSREQLREIGPYVRHLNLSFMVISADTITKIFENLIPSGERKNEGTNITSLSCSYEGISDDTLIAIASLKQRGFLPKLKAFRADTDTIKNSICGCCYRALITEKGMKALQQAQFFEQLEVIEFPRSIRGKIHVFSEEMLGTCKSLKKFKDFGYLKAADAEALNRQKVLKQLQVLSLPDMGDYSLTEVLQVLSNTDDMHVHHLELNERSFWLRAGQTVDLLQKVMKKVNTISFHVVCITVDQIRAFASKVTTEDLAKITGLRLSNCHDFSSELLVALSECMPNLVTLSLHKCTINEKGGEDLVSLFSRFRKLREFQCTNFCRKEDDCFPKQRRTFCTSADKPFLERLLQALPQLTKLTIDLDDVQHIKQLPAAIQQIPEIVIYGPRSNVSYGDYTVQTLNQVQVEELFASSSSASVATAKQ